MNLKVVKKFIDLPRNDTKENKILKTGIENYLSKSKQGSNNY